MCVTVVEMAAAGSRGGAVYLGGEISGGMPGLLARKGVT